MKEQLLVISDLWGFQNSPWIALYLDRLAQDFEISEFDCYLESEINPTITSETDIHQYFITKGIEICIEKLTKITRKKTSILAFSIGGTIAWKTALKGSKYKLFFAVSATRLRLENKRPTGNIALFYGAEDNSRPREAWFEQNNISYTLYHGKKHNLYMNSDSCTRICSTLINENKLL
ncbi:MAG: alpha/beta hydrolase [Flavobacteriaceae bacterium]|nr:MAG: alpha/beta hydrolase [Flavobacteriaceae bacterium]